MTLKNHHKLLLTGAAGGLGRRCASGSRPIGEVLRLSDRISPGDAGPGEEVAPADLADAAAVNAMVQGVDAIVHMGGISVEGPFDPILQANIVGVHNLYEAARVHGVKRVVFAELEPRHRLLTARARPSPPTARRGRTGCTA